MSETGAGSLREWLSTAVDLFEELTRAHESVVMDTPEDQARQAEVLRTMRRGAEALRLKLATIASTDGD